MIHVSRLLFATVLLCLGLSLTLPRNADAEVRLFAYGGGGTVQTIREEEDILQNPIEVEHWKESWEAGAGLRIISDPGAPISLRKPAWELRVRGGVLGGELEAFHFEFRRDRFVGDSLVYAYGGVRDESFEYSGLSLGVTAVAKVHPMLGFYAGPAIHRISFDGRLVDDRFCEGRPPGGFGVSCEDRTDKAEGTVLYGLLEVGTRIAPSGRVPAAFEFFWIPRRVQMSSSQTAGGGGYVAEFPDLDASIGGRITYDF